jgi:hypothetical protein
VFNNTCRRNRNGIAIYTLNDGPVANNFVINNRLIGNHRYGLQVGGKGKGDPKGDKISKLNVFASNIIAGAHPPAPKIPPSLLLHLQKPWTLLSTVSCSLRKRLGSHQKQVGSKAAPAAVSLRDHPSKGGAVRALGELLDLKHLRSTRSQAQRPVSGRGPSEASGGS